MSLFSSLFRPSLNRQQRRVPRPNSARRRLVMRVKPTVECLENRVVPSSSPLTDPYTLYTYGDDYIAAKGQDQQSFLANYHAFDPSLGASSASSLLRLPGPIDPGTPGSFAVTTEEYNLGDLAFRPTHAAWATSGTELTGEIKAPTDLGTTAHPVIVLMHGRHATAYSPPTGGGLLEWPPGPGHVSIPSYRGYDYLGDVLASQGYVVVSIGVNGINARDNNEPFPDLGMTARAEVMQRTFGILEDLNRDGIVNTRPADPTHPGTDLFSGPVSPFGTRYVGALDLQNIGLMGHSRGGEGVVRSFILNQSLGSPYGIKAVFAVAPVDFMNSTINNVPFAVLLPYNDGDVSDLQGVHFYDDSRYNVSGDTGPKFSIEVMGADHNFYNTVWSPGLFPFIGAPAGAGGTGDDGNGGPPSRLTETQQQGTGLAYMSAFFRVYLGGETQFLPILTGDAPPPPSATVTPDRIHIGYLPADNPTTRRDVNRLTAATTLSVNTLGGAVVNGGLASYAFTTTGAGSSEPHRSLGQVTLGYSGTLATYWENDLPAGAGDESAYNDLQFRVGVNYADPRNPPNTAQDFSVELFDGSGQSSSVLVSAYSNNLFDPPTPGGNPHEVLNTVRIPLSAYLGAVDLTNVIAIRLAFDQHNSGAFQVTDLAFTADQVSSGPLVLSSTPSGNVAPAVDHVHMVFNRSMDPNTFTPGNISLTAPDGSSIDASGVAVPMTNNTQFDITFAPQGLAGHYTLVLTGITDVDGNPLPTYTTGFTITSPTVVSTTPAGGTVAAPFNDVVVTFDRSMDPTTVTTDNITLTDPSGAAIPLVSITPVGSDNTQFDITFADQTAAGAYTLAISTGVQDTYTNPITAFSRQFNILPTGSNLVTNGGFEDPLGSEWTIVDPSMFTARVAVNPHTGSFALELGATGADGTATQTLTTMPGQSYTFSFWYLRDGQTPSDLHVFWNGMGIYDEVDSPGHAYEQHSFTVTATGTSTDIQFAARNVPGFDYLDDVSVISNG